MRSIAELRNHQAKVLIDETNQRVRTGLRFEAPKYRPPTAEKTPKASAYRVFAQHMGNTHPRVEAARKQIVATRRANEQAHTLSLAMRVNELIQHRPHGLVPVGLPVTRPTSNGSRAMGMFRDAARRRG